MTETITEFHARFDSIFAAGRPTVSHQISPLRRLALCTALFLCCVLTLTSIPPVIACPFCSAIAPTISDDLETSTAAVVTQCESVSSGNDGVYIYRLRVVEVIKGSKKLGKTVVEVASIERLPKDGLFWQVGYGEGSIEWSFPKPISSKSIKYLHGLRRLPAQGPKRLEYFLTYLRHSDDFIANDAYNEFAEASLDDIAALRDRLDRQWVIRQLKDSSVPAHHRRLCWTFLSQCGNETDVTLFDEMLRKRKSDAKYDPGMDAAIGCFMSLGGERALKRVENDFLMNPNASYIDTFAATNAIRIHGTELTAFSRTRLSAALRGTLHQPALADVVIPDLARWEDWSAIDKVSELFANATEETRFVKPAAVMYLTKCPLPAAAESLERLRKIDPEAVRAAEASMRFYGGLATLPVPPPETASTSKSNFKR